MYFKIALAGMAQWIECQPADRKAASSISSQAHAWVGGVREATDRCFSCTMVFLSLVFSLLSHLSKNK